MSRWKLKDHNTVIGQQTVACMAQVAAKVGVMIEPPEAMPRKRNMRRPRAVHTSQLLDRDRIIGRRSPILARAFEKREDAARAQLDFRKTPLIVIHQNKR